MQKPMRVADGSGADARGHQLPVPLLYMCRLELLELDAAEVRNDLLARQLPVALERLRRQAVRRVPQPGVKVLRYCYAIRRNGDPGVDLAEQAG